jgi:hypothetical protein
MPTSSKIFKVMLCVRATNVEMNLLWEIIGLNPIRSGKNIFVKKCKATQLREYKHKNGVKAMSENKDCPAYLGVHIAEQMLSKVFKDIEVMPYGYKGYDFICNKGKKIDVKCASLVNKNTFVFNIKRNTIADYFLCLAVDNRADLNPMYAWLLPSDKVGHLTSASTRLSKIKKWDAYKLDIDKLTTCCNELRNK